MSARRFAGAGLMRRPGSRWSAPAVSSSPPTLDALGADLLYHWEMAPNGSPYITVDGSTNIQTIVERVAGVANPTGAAGVRPAFVANGGPNNLPCANMQDANRIISAAISIPAGNRVGMFFVCAEDAVNGFVSCRFGHAGGSFSHPYSNATQFQHRCQFTGGQQSISINGKDTNWHLRAFLPYATGAESQIDGAVTAVDFAGTDTLLEFASFSVGYGGGISDGRWYATFAVADITPEKTAIVEEYVSYYTAIAMAA